MNTGTEREGVNALKLSNYLYDLIGSVTRYRALVDDPHPGLFSWNQAYQDAWECVEKDLARVRNENGMEGDK
jgi:hypothetical protein